jgi:hypothetical protein
MTRPRTQHRAWQRHVSGRIRHEANGAVRRGLVLKSRAVGDQGGREVADDDPPKIPADDLLGIVGEVERVEAGGELAKLAGLDRA